MYAIRSYYVFRFNIRIRCIRCDRTDPVFVRVDQIRRANTKRAVRMRLHIRNLFLEFVRACPVVVPFADGDVLAAREREDVMLQNLRIFGIDVLRAIHAP